MNTRLQQLYALVRSRFAAVHRDERGTISIMTVFALFMFTILLVKIVNVGRHVDDKIRMQNAADASAYSGGVVMARGMNVLAFTNHLESEVFALTAYLRTARMRDDNGKLVVQALTPDILAKWDEVGKVFEEHGGQANYTKFQRLGKAIQTKVPLERNVVAAFSEMSARHADLTLPVMEYILHAGDGQNSSPTGQNLGQPVNVPQGGIIPRFQRALIQSTPNMATLAGDEIAQRYGQAGKRLRGSKNVPLQSRMWRTDAVSFRDADESDPLRRTLPAIDPSPYGSDGPPNMSYYTNARNTRRALAQKYLEFWIRDWMGPYFSYSNGGPNQQNRPGAETAKMSQFINLWRSFACGHLAILLDAEYRDINLPHMIRQNNPGMTGSETLERDYQFVSVAYWSHIDEMFPGLLKNRLKRNPGSDAQTFAQVSIFIPRRRYICCPWSYPVIVNNQVEYPPRYEGWPQRWDLFTQNWTCKLVPANSASILSILQQAPSDLPNFRPPRFQGVSVDDFRRINKH